MYVQRVKPKDAKWIFRRLGVGQLGQFNEFSDSSFDPSRAIMPVMPEPTPEEPEPELIVPPPLPTPREMEHIILTPTDPETGEPEPIPEELDPDQPRYGLDEPPEPEPEPEYEPEVLVHPEPWPTEEIVPGLEPEPVGYVPPEPEPSDFEPTVTAHEVARTTYQTVPPSQVIARQEGHKRETATKAGPGMAVAIAVASGLLLALLNPKKR